MNHSRGSSASAPRAALASALCLTLAAMPGAGLAQPLSLGEIMPNFVGAGVGFAPSYAGSDRTTVGVAPGARISLGGERFVALAGPFLEANLLNSRWFQAGPVLNYRFGRSDAEDRAVRALGSLDPALEIGGRIGVGYVGTSPIPFRARAGINVLGDATGKYGGVQFLPAASLWVPLSPAVFVGAGVAARIGSASQNRHYFGVSEAGAAASGLPQFQPSRGVTSVSAWPALVWRINESWAVGGGLLYTRLADEVAGSPIVRRGSRDQLVGGVGIAYTW